MTVINAESTVQSEILIDAPAAKVFAALTEPDQLTQWWGDDSTYRVTSMERDLTVGGKWKTTGQGSNGQPFAVEGIYRTIDPPHVLEYTWRYDWAAPGAGETLVRIELTEEAGSTLVRVTHSGFTDAQDRDNHGEGWKRVLGWLAAFVA
jgi:uncharacterized protein YndB with AHSA1/START domain